MEGGWGYFTEIDSRFLNAVVHRDSRRTPAKIERLVPIFLLFMCSFPWGFTDKYA
jgi:hypothetical protein